MAVRGEATAVKGTVVKEDKANMEITTNIELVASCVLTIWSIALVWASWQIDVMTRALAEERAELRRWVRLKGLWEAQQRGRWQ
jgi:hypothetical protein